LRQDQTQVNSTNRVCFVFSQYFGVMLEIKALRRNWTTEIWCTFIAQLPRVQRTQPLVTFLCQQFVRRC